MKGLFFDRYGELRTWAFSCCMVLLILGVLTAIVMPIIIGSNHSTHVSCKALSEYTQLETQVKGPKVDPTCYVKLDGSWVPATTWINNQER